MRSVVAWCPLLFLLAARADVVERFEVRNISERHIWLCTQLLKSTWDLFSQDQPECLKHFYEEKVPEWGSSTPGAARLCQRFDNRCRRQWWRCQNLWKCLIQDFPLQLNANSLHQVPFCHSLRHQPANCRLLGLFFPAKQWRWSRETVVCGASGWCGQPPSGPSVELPHFLYSLDSR